MLIDVLELHKLTLAVMEKQSILNHKKKKNFNINCKKNGWFHQNLWEKIAQTKMLAICEA